jgi:hypothetical protein
MIFNFSSLLPFVIVMNIVLYSGTNLFKLMVFNLFRERTNSPFSYFLPYVPLMVFYHGYYLRFVRTIAYFKEFFFKESYKDPWNPTKTSIKALEIGI